jgi:hypothetical protein
MSSSNGSSNLPSSDSVSEPGSKAARTVASASSALDSSAIGSSREIEESDDLLSDYTSETTFFDEERSPSTLGEIKDNWQFVYYKIDGRVHIFGEWVARTKSHRYVVIGPDWACVAMTYIVIVVPSVFVYLYLLENLAEKVVFFVLFGLTVFGLTTVFVADPGLVRKYHHARSRHWTYW